MIDLFKQSYHLTRKNYLVLLGLLAVVGILMFVLSLLQGLAIGTGMLNFVLNIVFTLLRIFVSVAVLKLCLLIVDHREPEFAGIKPAWAEAMKYLMFNLMLIIILIIIVMAMAGLMGMIGFIRPGLAELYQNMFFHPEKMIDYSRSELTYGILSLLLLSLPAIILYLRLQFGAYLIIDKKMEVGTAIMRSLAMTKGYTFYIVLIYLLILLLNIIGLLLFVVGLLFTIPMTMVLTAVLYRTFDDNFKDPREASYVE